MPRKRHRPDEIIKKLRQAQSWQAEGATLAQVCQRLEVSEQTLHRWRQQYGGMPPDAMKRLRELEAENRRLKRLVADLSLDKQILKEVAEGKW